MNEVSCENCRAVAESYGEEPKCDKGEYCPNKKDVVNHPSHYTSHPSGVECYQIIQHEPFLIGSAIKYIWRRKLKGSEVQDLKKAINCIEKEVIRIEGEQCNKSD